MHDARVVVGMDDVVVVVVVVVEVVVIVVVVVFVIAFTIDSSVFPRISEIELFVIRFPWNDAVPEAFSGAVTR